MFQRALACLATACLLVVVGCHSEPANDTIPQTGQAGPMQKIGNTYIVEPPPAGQVPPDYPTPAAGRQAPTDAGAAGSPESK